MGEPDYMRFLNHCQKEFCTENLFFIVLMVQWQQFLIENNFQPSNSVSYDTKMIKSNIIVDLMKNSPVFEKLNCKIKDIHNKNIENGHDFSIFGEVVEFIYKKYIEANRAPFELNISFVSREKIRYHYLNINQLKKESFWQLWDDLLILCDELFEMIDPCLARCFK